MRASRRFIRGFAHFERLKYPFLRSHQVLIDNLRWRGSYNAEQNEYYKIN